MAAKTTRGLCRYASCGGGEIYSRDEHTMVPDVTVISTKVLNKLSDKERKALYKAADESMQQMKDVIWPAAEKEAYESMKAMNATVVDIDKSAFKQRVKPLFDEFRAKDAQSAKDLEYIENINLPGRVLLPFTGCNMRILTNALNKILAGCCCIILAVMVACVSSAGGGALYIQRAKQHARRIHPDSFYVDDSVRRRLYRRIKTFSYRFVSAKTLPNARPHARQYHSGDYYRVRADFYGVRR